MKILITIILVLHCTLSHSFINIESLRSNSKRGLTRSAKLLYNEQKGNTDKILASASTLNSYLKDEDEYIFIANYRYGESFDRKDTQDGNVHLRYTKHLFNNKYLENYIQFESNKFKDLNFREVYGSGLRITHEWINFGSGAFFEHEEIESSNNQDAVRANIYVSTSIDNKTGLEFSTILYYQPSLKRKNDNRIILNTGISQRVSNSINLIIEYQYVYDQAPPPGIKKFDSALLMGINII